MNRNGVVIVALSVLLSGCGYSFYNLAGKIRSVYVFSVKNEIKIVKDYSSISDLDRYYPHIEQDIQTRLVDRFLKDGLVKSQDEENADLVIKPVLIDYKKVSVSYSESDDVLRWRVSIGMNVDIKLGDKSWTKVFYGTAILDENESEADVVREAVDDLVRNVFDFIVTRQE